MSIPTRIGFTGSRYGMSVQQRERFIEELKAADPQEFHHGDCVGGDEQAHKIIRTFYPKCKIHSHPMKNSVLRAFCRADVVYQAKRAVDRNHDIVDAVELVIAAPQTDEEVLRSGTWATVRYAFKCNKPPILLKRGEQR